MNATPQRNSKRTALPKQLEKLDVALEREKSVKARQKQSTLPASSKYEANAGSSSSLNGATTTREKSPTKQRNATNKVAVAANDSQPTKRPASAPVHPVAKSDLKPTRASASQAPGNPSPLASKRQQTGDRKPSSAVDSAGAKATDVPSRRTAFENSGGGAEGGGTDDDNDTDNGNGGDVDDKDAPARGHYDIFIQTRKCEDLCRDLGLTLKHIRRMKKKYDENDMYCTYVMQMPYLAVVRALTTSI